MGTAWCVWDDMEYLMAQGVSGHLMAINYAALHSKWPIDHMASYHPEMIGVTLAAREFNKRGGESHIHGHSHKAGPRVDIVWPLDNGGGTSGMFAVQVAHLMGYERIILAGVPLDNKGRFYDHPSWQDVIENYDGYAIELVWQRCVIAIDELKNKIRSVSGKTKDMFGGI